MKTLLVGLVLGILLSFGGFLLFNYINNSENSAEEAQVLRSYDAPYYMPEQAPQPNIEVLLHQDATSGWNLEFKTTDFIFSPENVGGANVPGTGYIQIYLNNVKYDRAYSNWYHIKELPAGTNIIVAALNTNDHYQIYSNKEAAEAEIKIYSEEQL